MLVRPGATPQSVITDRETLRKHPPDILLTNYKMLDYLMLRPKDRQDPDRVTEAKTRLDRSYGWLSRRIGTSWASGS